ncbi:pyridoxal phosphate-dependent transferase [Mycena pura]|uniref:Pyridoxal phosphate-dependent transferase n=1 Tax=Mycena pura TaxID=153505 RepID=A0AAD6VSH4_9AGAR|nr:pyridoxal phosphate-dependent transferase [Mycena pura]
MSNSAQLESLLVKVTKIAVDFVKKGEEGAPVIDFRPGPQLEHELSLKFPTEPVNHTELLATIQNVFDNSVNPWGQCFLDKLYTCTNPVGVISETVLGVLNANSHVYKASPALTIIELETAKRLASLFGLPEGSGGLTMPGGSASNRLALVTAINNLIPESRIGGIASLPKRPVVFTSAHSHYSIDQAALTSGLGLAGLRKIKTDTSGRMIVEELERGLKEAVDAGELPIFINATAGTTVTGAFDPIPEIAVLAKKYGCWLHVDGSWGGALAFSETHRAKLAGVEHADSVTFNPHKLLAVPLICSFLLLRNRTSLKANNLGADYLFHGNKYDLGDGTTGCGRRPDAFKFFLAWQASGSNGFGRSIDQALAQSARLVELIKSEPNLELVLDHDSTTPQVCFRYVRNAATRFTNVLATPPGSGRGSPTEEGAKFDAEVYSPQEMVRKIQGRILQRGRVMVDFCPINSNDAHGEEIGDVFRVPMHPNVPFSSFEHIVSEVVAVGAELY